MTKKTLALIVLCAFVALGLASVPARAGGPVFFELEKRADIEKGDSKGISISENGALSLAPTFDTVYDTGQTYVWSSVADARGTVYLGTGHEGRVYSVQPGGAGKLVLDTAELDVTALALDPTGVLYAATSPDGKIYRIAADGSSSVYFDPEEKYIWSLAVKDGVVYAGTGETGVIYKITAPSKSEVWVDTDEIHVVSLAFAANGDLLAGTDPNALVLRIGADGKPFAILDTPLQETHDILVSGDGSIYALMISASAATTSSEQGSVSVEESRTTTVGKLDLANAGTADSRSRRDTSDAKSAIYRILPDGSSDVVWASRSVVAYAAHLDAGRILVGTGDRGRIVAVDAKTLDTTVLLQSTEDQTSTFVSAGGAVYATSNNLGKLFKVGPGPVAKGTFESAVHDAKTTSKWGRVVVRSTAAVTAETRSGNTETPDSTWSAWTSVPLSGGSGPIASPAARYVQWRLALSGADARIQSSAISYLPKNISPEVTQLIVLPAGIGLQELPQQPIDPGILASGFDPSIFGLSTNLPPRKIFQTGARSLIWQAKDPDDDKLSYSIYFRTTTETAWHPLAVGLDGAYYTIDSAALPDGIYVFKLVADDSPGNPAPSNLTGEDVTEPVEIDNTPPSVVAGKPATTGQTVDVAFTAEDTTSRITRCEYSVDGGAWTAVYPEDGIADSLRESVRVRTAALVPGEHSIALRVVDASLNVGSAKVVVAIR